ncbi:MAG: DNA internalization-related competence protein ComEC/Rec2 [Anaerolinea sp.]|nr:DNA internalization-related competence protein ComEC/Rec2 [Anaerolinea sp.]
MALVFVALAWLMGMAAVSLWGAPWWTAGAWLLLGSPLVLTGRDRVTTAIFAAGLAGALLSGWRFETWEQRASPQLARYVGVDVVLEGRIDSEPDPGLTTASYEVTVRQTTVGGSTEATEGKVRATLGQYANYLPGTRIRLTGALDQPPVFEDFDYRGYLARRGVVATTYFPRVEVLDEPGRYSIPANLAEMQLALESSLQRVLPEPEASLGAGIAFGRDGNLPDGLYDDFRATGLAHIVAVSGANVTLVTALTFFLAIPLVGRRWAMIPAGMAVIAYVGIAGLSPSVVRAGIMAVVFLYGAYLGRQQSSLAALGAATIVMTGWSPAFLRDAGVQFGPSVAQDLGFQLSLAATAGLIVFGPWIRWALLSARRCWRIEGFVPGALVEVAALTVSATVATLPLSWVNFGQVSLAGPLANLVVEPVFVIAFWLSAAAAVAGVVWEPAGWAIGLAAYYPLGFITWFAGWAASIPFAAAETPRASGELALLAYAALAALGWPAYWRLAPAVTPRTWAPNQNRRAVLVWSASAAAIVVLAVPVSLLPIGGPGDLEMSVLDVGQGDAILLTTPSGKRVLVDGGPSSIGLARELGAVLPHWQRRIDVVIVTHPQEDHIGGVPGLLRRYDVRAEWDTGATNMTMAASLYTQRAGRRRTVQAGDGFTIDGVRFEVLWPPPDYETKQLNDRSVVLRVTYGEVSMLLTGDFEAAAQLALMARGDVSADVLKVPHHGSKTSSAAFLKAVDPALAVISVGDKNRFGHPAEETLEALSGTRLLRTDQDGRVTVTTDGKRIRVSTER